MPRKRKIDAVPVRYCGRTVCNNPIPKQKPNGKWKTPTQYEQQVYCSAECNSLQRAQDKADRLTGKIRKKPAPQLDIVDQFLRTKR